MIATRLGLILIFQSTPSVGRATYEVLYEMEVILFQSTPSVGRATADVTDGEEIGGTISIHALRGEGDWTF